MADGGLSAGLIVETFENRDAWLAARRDPHVIGASEAAVALGVSPYGTPWKLFTSKIGRETDQRNAAPLQRGNRWEPAVLAEYEDESGNKVVTPGEFVGKPGHLVTLSNPKFPWLRESPDGFARGADGVLGHVEAKTAMNRDAWSPEPGIVIERWDDRFTDIVPAHYAIQVYVQLAVTGLPWNDACALVPVGGWLGVRWVRFVADPETQGQIVEALAAWREKHLVGGVAPDPDQSVECNRYLAKKFEKRPARPATAEERALIERHVALGLEIKVREAERDTLKNTLITRAEGSRLTCGDGAKAPYAQPQQNSGKRTLDVEALRRDHPAITEKYTRTGEPFVTWNSYRFGKDEA